MSFLRSASGASTCTLRGWGHELDPTRPVDPNLTTADLNGKTVAEVIEIYNGSAGGTGFDIGVLGLDWIQYVRIEDNPGSSATTEVDAIADVSCCGDYKHPYPVGDLNKDCRVDMADFAIFTSHWLECTWKCPQVGEFKCKAKVSH